ncbi:MAG: 4-hydroxythreonine-4-phosphate dehydrogenase PdxA [Desulfamplus sp.]|nr:4-hydroxythreonine-4-phosphate dehydrogenase PdxA [Desulfamplus sp.]
MTTKSVNKIAGNSEARPVIGITMGDPAGIGPEIIAAALEEPGVQEICSPLVIGDAGIMKAALKLKGSSLNIHETQEPGHALFDPGTIEVMSLSQLETTLPNPWVPTSQGGRAVIDYITRAVDLALAGEIAAMVTAPITKTALKMADSPFHGHTEMIAHKTGTTNYAMMLAGDKLRVILVTIHIPLSAVPGKLTVPAVVKTISIAVESLKERFGIENPRIAVAGLNPHAGEGGMFGHEEEEIIQPAIKKAVDEAKIRNHYVVIQGPFPPDTIFHNAAQGKYDCVVCMYHDQGLIPFKLLHFSDGVNTTLGLPIIRTSVDHGTAYDIAWQNRADHTSLVQAIKMAVNQARHFKVQVTCQNKKGRKYELCRNNHIRALY